MGLKIAEKLRKPDFTVVPTTSDSIPTSCCESKSVVPTIRHFRHDERAANDDHSLVSDDGMPTHFFDGGCHGWRFGDREWIKRKLRRVRNSAERNELAAEYARRYQQHYDAESCDTRKANTARFNTNKWLLNATK